MPFEEYKVSPMSVRPKPGGKIRLIVDLSSPHGVPSDSDLPNSVNNGIDPSKLKTKMSSITQVCERIWRTGYPAEFVKIDWVSGIHICIFGAAFLIFVNFVTICIVIKMIVL